MKKVIFLVFIMTSVISIGLAQPGPDDPSGDPDNPIPLGGVEYLLVAGGAYGISRIWKKKK